MALSTQRASTSRTSAEWAPPHWKHDVFLSFRGEDTRSGFLSHLYHELQYWQAIKTFKDDRDLEIGATISPELFTAIEESHLAIIVLSPNYASSAWCLDELSKIRECMQGTERILPIFYHVDPSDVRNQRGSFAEAFTKHEEKFSEDVGKVKWWRDALKEVANLSGCDSKNYPSEAELIKHIVKCVFRKVHPTFMLSGSLDKLVGIDSALEQLHLHLAPEDNDVHFIGICGMGGLGKTTLAKLVFDRISHHFELSSFLSNVKEVSGKQGGLVNLQRQILFPILKENVAYVWDEEAGTSFLQNRLWNKKVLLVLDDVGQLNQLEKLVGNKKWFGVGSRIIITTRDERLLVQHGIKKLYKVVVLKDDKALELFCRHAFKEDQPKEGFQELSRHFLDYAKGLPLALKTLGLALYGRDQDAWKSVLHNLNKIPNPDIFDSLKVSYYGLKEREKIFFLHVACLHRGKSKEQVIQVLDCILDISSRIEIDILIEKSLLTIEEHHFGSNIVEMHDLIQEMAWKIVREESPEPGKRSLLWHHSDISHVFMNNSGTGAIEGMVLALPKLEEVPWNCTEAFNGMHGLRLLDFYNVMFSSGPKFLPNSLRIIHWSSYPSRSLPSSFEPHLLSNLEMRGSKLVRLWDGAKVGCHYDCIVWPGSEIPDWFDNQSVGDSIIVEPPLPPQTCSDWVGVALCAVLEDSEHLKHLGYEFFRICCSFGGHSCEFEYLGYESQHLSVFYLPRNATCRLSFYGCYGYWRNGSNQCGHSSVELDTSSLIKKCGARLVYKRDLEEFSRILKIPMPAVNGYDDDDEAWPSDSSEDAYDPRSDSSDDEDEPISNTV